VFIEHCCDRLRLALIWILFGYFTGQVACYSNTLHFIVVDVNIESYWFRIEKLILNYF
jgi:hypothetical protein